MSARACIAALALVLAVPAFAQPITEAAAIESGRAADAAALARIIALGNAQLVRAFNRGMALARIEQMPAPVEALVAAHFDDSRVGEALRDHSPRYRTRALFDRHYARVQAAYRADEPSFKQILRTEQPGIDEALLRVADKFPVAAHELNPVAIFAGQRKHPAAVPLLVASIEQGYRILGSVPPMHNRPMSLLLDYPSPETWRRASQELERLNAAKLLSPAAYRAGREQLDRALADPGATLARMRRRDLTVEYERRRAALEPVPDALRQSAPREYVERQRRYLAAVDEIVTQLGDETLAYRLSSDYLALGLHVRFKVRDARAAAEILEKAAEYHDAMGQLALADVYQLDLKDKPNAIRAYEMALAEASRPTEGRAFAPYTPSGSPTNRFWRAWLAQEIDFLQGGRPFRGRIPEVVIAGFFDMMFGNSGAFVDALSADLPLDPPSTGALRLPAYMRLYPEVSSWEDARDAVEAIERSGLAEKLERLPPSRIVLLAGLRPISALSAQQILRQLERNDPSGYWSACILGAASYHASKGAAGRDQAVRNGFAQAMPGIAAPGKPNALASAASQFLAARGLRVALTP